MGDGSPKLIHEGPVRDAGGLRVCVIGPLRVAPEANEITAALTLLKGLPLQGASVTGDAMFCQRAICQSIRDAQGDDLFAVKANQPELMADLVLAFGDAFPPGTGQGAEGGRRGPSIGP